MWGHLIFVDKYNNVKKCNVRFLVYIIIFTGCSDSLIFIT